MTKSWHFKISPPPHSVYLSRIMNCFLFTFEDSPHVLNGIEAYAEDPVREITRMGDRIETMADTMDTLYLFCSNGITRFNPRVLGSN